MAKQHERAQRRIVLVLIEHLRKPGPRRRVDAVLDGWPVETNEHDIASSLHRDRCGRREGDVDEVRHGSRGRHLVLRANHDSGCGNGGSCQERAASDLR